LEDLGLDVPSNWAGKSPARRFVADLGFPPDHAGFGGEHRPAAFGVDGPAVLPSLHDYQAFVVNRIKDLLHGEGPARGMVSLPTGAGKTRVAVQALIEEISAGSLVGPIVWVAQSDELCDQAVETWSHIWRACGPADRMTISRLWGTNEVEEVVEGFHLIVATIDKLEAIRSRAESRYDWITDPTVVIVDEAHTSIAPSYTRVLDWMGRGQSRKVRRPLLGLTATPFRGTSSDETQRLVNRYDKNRLDLGAFERDDPYGVLQERQVLARVDHRQLDGVDVKLTSAEAREVEQLRRLPASVETQLGGNQERNLRIVESIKQLPQDWTVLLFATSVENASVLAALLTYEGIPSIAISGGTDRRERRHYVEEFKAGRIRVITNFAVLAQGFDAPRVQAVYVTRPTFSPNNYQQMIGRGLRGPKNGGSEEVLIVDVADNFSQFGELLSFREFEPLWTQSRE
jgi:superfamily II DNA or RNA helicase